MTIANIDHDGRTWLVRFDRLETREYSLVRVRTRQEAETIAARCDTRAVLVWSR